MLSLLLSLFFHYDLFNCDAFEKANFNSNGPLTTEHEATRNHNIMDCSITDIMLKSTPGTDQMNPITPHYSFLPTQIDHGTYIQSSTGPTPKGPSFTAERFPQAIRRNQKIHQIQQGITVVEIVVPKRRNPEPKASSSDPGRWSREPVLHRMKRSQTLSTRNKKRLFPNVLLSNGKGIIGDDTYTDDESEKTITQMHAGEGIFRIRKIPDITKKLWYSDRTEISTAVVAKQFLRQNRVAHHHHHRFSRKTSTARHRSPPSTATSTVSWRLPVANTYFEMIETLQEGYMMVFLIELTRLIATKERKAVRDVVKHTDQIIHGLYQSGQLVFFGKPLINVMWKVARLLKELEIDVIQNRAANLHHMLSQRHQELSVEVNTILEYADMLYDDDEGRLLFDALKEFAAYPNIPLTGYWVCNSLIHNFLRPYRRLKDTQQRREIMELEFKSYKKTPLRSRDDRQADDPPDENQPSPQTESVTKTAPHSDTTRQLKEKKRKRHHRSHKSKRVRRRHRIFGYRPDYSQRYYQKHISGSMTQRTSVQSRFRVKKQKT